MASTEHPGRVQYQCDTVFGMVDVTPTDANHVHVSAGMSGDSVGPITVNGVELLLSAHLHRLAGGFGFKEYHGLSLQRPGYAGAGSDAARRKVQDVLPVTISNLLRDEPDILRAGEVYGATCNLHAKERDAAAALAKYREASAELRAARKRHADAAADPVPVEAEVAAVPEPDAEPMIHLQGWGLHPARRADTLKPGDVLRYNYGHTYTVQSVREASPQFVEVVESSDKTGDVYTRKAKKSRLFAVVAA